MSFAQLDKELGLWYINNMYIRILDYLIKGLNNLREKARTPTLKGMTVKEWATKNKKSYK